VTDTEDNVTEFVNDFEDRRVSLSDPNSGYSTYEYDSWSRLSTVRVGSGPSDLPYVTTMGYAANPDASDRLVSRSTTDHGVTSSSASWTYGSGSHFGELTSESSSTRIDGVDYTTGRAYTYDTYHRPVTVSTTLPNVASLGDLKNFSYATTVGYDDIGQASTVANQMIGDLPGETVSTGLDRWGRPVGLTVVSSNKTYTLVSDVTWDGTGLLLSRTYGDGSTRMLSYDYGLRAVSRLQATGGGVTYQDDLLLRDGDTDGDGDLNALGDGRLMAVVDAHLSVSPVTQCYGYNGLNRLDEAWTITGVGTSCATSFATQSPSTLDTSATSYGSGWEYSDAGRVTLVTNLLDSSTRTYDYDTTHPAAVIEVEEADSTSTVTGTDLFAYDDVGRMVSRDTATGEMELTWDVSSNLVKTVEDDETVLYVYDTSGQRVARIEATTATAYLGSVEVTDPDTDTEVTGDMTATRFYTLGGATVATRTATSLSFLFGDHQGSAEVMVTHPIGQDDTLDLETPPTVTRNAYTPYGTTRDTYQLSIDHGWLNQITDESSTGLIYLNARYYDPILSRFLSPDPLMNPTDPKTLDPYRYADNNPIVYQDPSGLAGPGCIDIRDPYKKEQAASLCFLQYVGLTTGNPDLEWQVDWGGGGNESQHYLDNYHPKRLTNKQVLGKILNLGITAVGMAACASLGPVTAAGCSAVAGFAGGTTEYLVATPKEDWKTGDWLKVAGIEAAFTGILGGVFRWGLGAPETSVSTPKITTLTPTESAPRFVAGANGIIDTSSPALRQQIGNVVDSLSTTGKPPAGVRQGSYQGQPGVYANLSGDLPARPLGYYTESDVWPGTGPRGTERIVTGQNGEVWYSPDHYGTFRSWPW
jgi:RHS repeat-associated protein